MLKKSIEKYRSTSTFGNTYNAQPYILRVILNSERPLLSPIRSYIDFIYLLAATTLQRHV